MSLTVREVMQKLSKEHPDAPCRVRLEKLRYETEPGQEDAWPPKWVLVPEETEIEQVPVESVTRSLDGSVVIG
jgi:hypothetical protein